MSYMRYIVMIRAMNLADLTWIPGNSLSQGCDTLKARTVPSMPRSRACCHGGTYQGLEVFSWVFHGKSYEQMGHNHNYNIWITVNGT